MPQVCSTPTLTVCQSPDPISSSTANRRTEVVGSEQAASIIAAIGPAIRATLGDNDGMNERGGKTALRAAMIFGIVAATVEMGIVLWMMYC